MRTHVLLFDHRVSFGSVLLCVPGVNTRLSFLGIFIRFSLVLEREDRNTCLNTIIPTRISLKTGYFFSSKLPPSSLFHRVHEIERIQVPRAFLPSRNLTGFHLFQNTWLTDDGTAIGEMVPRCCLVREFVAVVVRLPKYPYLAKSVFTGPSMYDDQVRECSKSDSFPKPFPKSSASYQQENFDS